MSKLEPITESMSGKTCLITGASAGIGEETARQLAQLGAHVILGCRDGERGKTALTRLQQRVPAGRLELMQVDVASQASIRSFAKSVSEAHPRLDVLVNNAGIWIEDKRRSPDGIELVWATNVLGYHLLTAELLDLMRKSTPARVVNVASTFAYGLDLDDVQFERRRFNGSAAYAQSKQADRMLTWALARALEGTGITANALHPGAVDTQMLHHSSPGFRGRSVEQGADTVTWLAASRQVEGVSGRFWIDRREHPCEFTDPKKEEALRVLCDKMTGLA